jgi:hypothetical protein
MNDDFESALAHEKKLQAELIARIARAHQNQASTASELRVIHALTGRLKVAQAARSRAAEREAAR